ncbi:MAG: hypothetical protein ACRD0W_00855 [Acidimicrobiales bacterium]
MWTEYDLTLHVDRLVGGIPRHPEIVRRWQEARWPDKPMPQQQGDPATVDEATDRIVENLGSQALSDEQVAGIWTGFVEHDGQIALEARNVKAMLKESANIVKALGPRSAAGKTRPLRAQLAERVFVAPKFILLDRTTPDETVERPVHVMTAQGPRTALKRTDVLNKVVVPCVLRVLDDSMFPKTVLELILDHACENGLGTDRSQGNGTFTYDLVLR